MNLNKLANKLYLKYKISSEVDESALLQTNQEPLTKEQLRVIESNLRTFEDVKKELLAMYQRNVIGIAQKNSESGRSLKYIGDESQLPFATDFMYECGEMIHNMDSYTPNELMNVLKSLHQMVLDNVTLNKNYFDTKFISKPGTDKNQLIRSTTTLMETLSSRLNKCMYRLSKNPLVVSMGVSDPYIREESSNLTIQQFAKVLEDLFDEQGIYKKYGFDTAKDIAREFKTNKDAYKAIKNYYYAHTNKPKLKPKVLEFLQEFLDKLNKKSTNEFLLDMPNEEFDDFSNTLPLDESVSKSMHAKKKELEEYRLENPTMSGEELDKLIEKRDRDHKEKEIARDRERHLGKSEANYSLQRLLKRYSK